MSEKRDKSFGGQVARFAWSVRHAVKKPFTLFEKDGNGGWDTQATSRILVIGAFLTEYMRFVWITVPKLVGNVVSDSFEPSQLTYHPAWSLVVLVLVVMGAEPLAEKLLNKGKEDGK